MRLIVIVIYMHGCLVTIYETGCLSWSNKINSPEVQEAEGWGGGVKESEDVFSHEIKLVWSTSSLPGSKEVASL